jgi:cell wall-associated NlpC family hydrolase
MSVQGSPYVWGAAGPNSFDCSGLVVWAFEQNGLSAPGGRTADNQGDGSATVATGPLTANLDKAQPGDLLFWDYENDGKWDHVGFYIGNGQMVHAPQPGSVVKVVPVYDAGAAMKIGRA